MADVLITTDSEQLFRELESVIRDRDITVRGVQAGVQVLPAVNEATPDLVILDLQIGNMGGMAVCLDLRLEEGMDRIPRLPVIMLLDRRADVFLARRADAQGWLVKPLDPIRVRRAVQAVLNGGTFYDESFRPTPATAAVTPATAAATPATAGTASSTIASAGK